MMWNPFYELELFQRRIDRMFGAPRRRVSSGYPPIDLMDASDKFILLAMLPGIKREEIDLSISERTIILRGERKRETAEGARYIRRERGYGAFEKRIELPEPIQTDKVSAHYTDGILNIILPKSRPLGPMVISID
ncbi:TPA: Hsp20/alpha crystallin family protein [Candidatus Poribacteria bacterium]|nr:Hsp20/alpha crystallin family protein [Candidatus Poribacteria bacterium]